MKPFYLRFPDAATGQKALAEAFPNGDQSLRVIGDAWRNDAVVSGMKLITPPTKRDGWFANWIGETLPASLEPYHLVPDPVSPFEVFAGWSPDEIAAREAAKNPPEVIP